MTELILIRHGQSQANKEGLFAGNYNAPLSDLGFAQAKLTADYVAKHYKVDRVYSSTLSRAYSTAQALADILHADIIKSDAMREICAGKWEGVSFEELEKTYPHDYQIWREHIGYARCTGGESTAELCQRVMAELTRIATQNDGKTVAIATHATPIRVSQCFITHGSIEKMEDVPWSTNASITVYRYDNGLWSIAATSIDEHLAGNQTALPPNV